MSGFMLIVGACALPPTRTKLEPKTPVAMNMTTFNPNRMAVSIFQLSSLHCGFAEQDVITTCVGPTALRVSALTVRKSTNTGLYQSLFRIASPRRTVSNQTLDCLVCEGSTFPEPNEEILVAQAPIESAQNEVLQISMVRIELAQNEVLLTVKVLTELAQNEGTPIEMVQTLAVPN